MSEAATLEREPSAATGLVVIEKKDALAYFSEPTGLDPIIEKIEREARAMASHDVSTARARQQIASVAYKVAQSKSYIDGLGKDLVADLKEIPRRIDASRKAVRDRLDLLRDEIRAPLDAWEAEQARIASEKAAQEAAIVAKREGIAASIAGFASAPLDVIGKPASVVAQRLQDLEAIAPTAEDFDDRFEEAVAIHAAAVEKIRDILAERTVIERRDQEDRDRQVAQEAEERARREADQKIIDAKLAQERAERQKAEAEERAIRAEREASERAERAATEAAARERHLAEEKAKREAEEVAKRAADIEHRKTINRAALAALITRASLTEEQGKAVIVAIIDGHIPNIRITY